MAFAFGAAALLMLGGCVHVAPAPIDLAARASARSSARIDLAAVRQRVALIAPGGTASPIELDRLGLFAALLEYDPKVAEARSAVLVAQREAAAARKVASPTLTLTSEYARDPSASSPWALGGAVDLPLDFGGRREARLTQADLAVLAARYALADTIWTERMALIRALIEVKAGERQAKVASAALALRDRQLAVLEDRARRGEIAPLDLAPYRAQRAQTARTLDDARARSATGRATLAGVLGLPAAALDGAALAWPDFAAPPAPPALDPAERAASAAARSDVLQALVAYDTAEAALRGELAKQYPSISLGPGYTWERGLVKLPFALSLALPSWDLNRAGIRAAEAQRAKAGASIETTIAAAEAAIETAASELAAAETALARIRGTELPQGDLAAARADRQLALGAISRADWSAAKITAAEARLAEGDALVRVRTAQAALEEALRRPIEGPELQISAPRGKDRP